MASEEASDPGSVSLPEDLSGWLERRAAERGVDPEIHLAEVLAAHRALDDGDVQDPPAPSELVTEADLDRRLLAVEEEHAELLEDVRDRIVQVKRETDAKAPADHDHDAIADLDARLQALATDVEALEDRLADAHPGSDGTWDVESTLDDLQDVTADLSGRADALARIVLSIRQELGELTAAAREREAVDRLKRDTALESVESADCEACGRTVRAALLTEPRCPACEATFVDLEPKQGLLGSATFRTGDRPPLAAGSGDDAGIDSDDDDDGDGDGGSTRSTDHERSGAVDWSSRGDDS